MSFLDGKQERSPPPTRWKVRRLQKSRRASEDKSVGSSRVKETITAADMPNKCEGRRPRQSAFDPPFSTRNERSRLRRRRGAADGVKADERGPNPAKIDDRPVLRVFSAGRGRQRRWTAGRGRRGAKKESLARLQLKCALTTRPRCLRRSTATKGDQRLPKNSNSRVQSTHP